MKKILFSDLDGTLFKEGKSISSKNLEALKQMRAKGHKVVLCTGRNHIDIQPVLKHIPIPYDYMVLCNGSYICDKQGHILYEDHVDLNVGKKLIQEIRARKHYTVMFCDDEGCYVLVDGKTKTLELNGLDDYDEDFDFLLNQAKRFYMLSMNDQDLSIEMVKEMQSYINQNYPELETHLNQQYLDISPKGHNKGTGLKKLLSLLDEEYESYAIGDSYNDLSMIEQADYGCTFDYANEDIQQKADIVVHYVYEIVDKLM